MSSDPVTVYIDYQNGAFVADWFSGEHFLPLRMSCHDYQMLVGKCERIWQAKEFVLTEEAKKRKGTI